MINTINVLVERNHALYHEKIGIWPYRMAERNVNEVLLECFKRSLITWDCPFEHKSTS